MTTQLGIVQSNNLNKNIKVIVFYHRQNKKYKSIIKVARKYTVLDIRNEAQQGDIVLITSTVQPKYNKKIIIKIVKKHNYNL